MWTQIPRIDGRIRSRSSFHVPNTKCQLNFGLDHPKFLARRANKYLFNRVIVTGEYHIQMIIYKEISTELMRSLRIDDAGYHKKPTTEETVPQDSYHENRSILELQQQQQTWELPGEKIRQLIQKTLWTLGTRSRCLKNCRRSAIQVNMSHSKSFQRRKKYKTKKSKWTVDAPLLKSQRR